MKTNWKVSLVAIIATVVSMGATAAEKSFNIGGDAEYDITYSKTTGASTSKSFSEGGRVKLNAKARIDNDNGSFVEAVVQPLFSFNDGKNSTAGTDDTYIKFGKKAWDIQLGRFEGIDLAPAGKDTVVEKAGTYGYGANKARGRSNDNIVHGAAHFNMGKAQVELGLAYGESGGVKTTWTRPAVKFDAGRFRIAAGYDAAQTETGSVTNSKYEGFGITAGTKVGTFDANFNVSQAKNKVLANANKVTTYGMNFTRGRFGAGYIHDKNQLDSATKGKQDTFYTAYSVPLMGSKDATVTFAASTSKAKPDGAASTKVNAARIRFNYSF